MWAEEEGGGSEGWLAPASQAFPGPLDFCRARGDSVPSGTKDCFPDKSLWNSGVVRKWMKHKGCEEREEGAGGGGTESLVAKSTWLSAISMTVTTEQGGDIMQSPAPHRSVPVRFGPANGNLESIRGTLTI